VNAAAICSALTSPIVIVHSPAVETNEEIPVFVWTVRVSESVGAVGRLPVKLRPPIPSVVASVPPAVPRAVRSSGDPREPRHERVADRDRERVGRMRRLGLGSEREGRSHHA